jgi:hypothetical protein
MSTGFGVPSPRHIHVRALCATRLTDGQVCPGASWIRFWSANVLLILIFRDISDKRKNSSIFTKKTEKRKPIPQGRREGMSRLPIKKFLPLKSIKRKKFFTGTRRAWPLQTCTPTYLCFSFLVFKLSSIY